IRVVKGLQLEVEEIVFNGLASALAILDNEAKELGALVIDLGAGTTDYTLYAQGVVKHTGVIAVGGDHVSNDIALGLRIPLSRAEQAKIEHGSAMVEEVTKGKTIAIRNGEGAPVKTVKLDDLHMIMALRIEEIFQIVAQQLHEAGLLDYLSGGVFLCGGGARIPNVTKVAEQIFQAPAKVGHATGISGLVSSLDQPEFATALGLVKFGSFKHRSPAQKSFLSAGLKSTLQQLFRRL
ncbi:MAG: cell division protein FtsA, partial [Verrucomicrobiae bacterium]|nr:cell division protein FtsA [Verrucomicrobiae bacterium]